MYNANQKQQFIESLPPKAKVHVARVSFEKLSVTELKLKKDLCNFNVEEIKSAYRKLNEYNVEYVYRVNSMMRKYADWCIENGLSSTKENDFSKLNINELLTCVSAENFISEQQIREWAYEVEDNPVNPFLISAPFYGLSKENEYEEFVLTRDNIDLPINGAYAVLTLPTRKLTVPRYVAHYALDAIESTEYFIPSSDGTRQVGHRYEKSNNVIKFIAKRSNNECKIDNLILGRYSHLFKKKFGDNSLTFTKVFRSGMVHHAKYIMQQHHAQNVDDVYDLPDFQKEVIERFRLNKSQYSAYFFMKLVNEGKSSE